MFARTLDHFAEVAADKAAFSRETPSAFFISSMRLKMGNSSDVKATRLASGVPRMRRPGIALMPSTIFVVLAEREALLGELGFHGIEAAQQLVAIGLGQDPTCSEHPGVRARLRDVLRP